MHHPVLEHHYGPCALGEQFDFNHLPLCFSPRVLADPGSLAPPVLDLIDRPVDLGT